MSPVRRRPRLDADQLQFSPGAGPLALLKPGKAEVFTFPVPYAMGSVKLSPSVLLNFEVPMPHVVVKLYAGKTEQQKSELATKIAEALMSTLGSSDASISVGIEEFDPKQWKDAVFTPDIAGKASTLYKKPGYEPA